MSLLLPLYYRIHPPINKTLLLAEYQALKPKQLPWYLISVAGQQINDYAQSAYLQATADLSQCPYIQNILADFNNAIARVWFNEKLSEQDETLHSCEYQAWVYIRVLISVDAKTDLVIEIERHHLEMLKAKGLTLMHKQCLNILKGGFNALEVMIFDNLMLPIRLACNELDIEQQQKIDLHRQLENRFQEWKNTFEEFGQDSRGELIYRQILITLGVNLQRVRSQLSAMAKCALQILTSSLDMVPSTPRRINRQLIRNRQIKRELANAQIQTPIFKRPVFIVSAPRAGSTLLFNSLSGLTDLWTTGEENHRGFEKIAGLHPKDHNYHSNKLDADMANSTVKTAVTELYSRRLLQKNQVYAELAADIRPKQIRFLEKTPKNALRIPFLKSLFPDAQFIYLYREPLGNISSLIEGWRSRRFIAYQNLNNWRAKDWQFLLIPEWQKLDGQNLTKVCASQWASANQTIITDLQKLAPTDWHYLSYQDLIDQPVQQLKTLAQFIEVKWNPELEQLDQELPLTTVTLSQPFAEKWRKYQQELEKIKGQTYQIEKSLATLLKRT